MFDYRMETIWKYHHLEYGFYYQLWDLALALFLDTLWVICFQQFSRFLNFDLMNQLKGVFLVWLTSFQHRSFPLGSSFFPIKTEMKWLGIDWFQSHQFSDAPIPVPGQSSTTSRSSSPKRPCGSHSRSVTRRSWRCSGNAESRFPFPGELVVCTYFTSTHIALSGDTCSEIQIQVISTSTPPVTICTVWEDNAEAYKPIIRCYQSHNQLLCAWLGISQTRIFPQSKNEMDHESDIFCARDFHRNLQNMRFTMMSV